MLSGDHACSFMKCPRCDERGWERFSTHSYCVNCNYEEIYSDELLSIPPWAAAAISNVKPKSLVREVRPIEREEVFEYAAV